MTIQLDIKQFQSRYLLRKVLLLVLLALGLTLFNMPTVSAADDPVPATGTVDQLRTYCKNLDDISDNAKKGCTNGNLEKARNVASYKCTDASLGNGDNRKDACILREAKKYVKKLETPPRPTNATELTNKLINKILLPAAGGDASKLDSPSDDSEQGANPNCDSNGTECISCEGGICRDDAANPDLDCNKDDGCSIIKKYVNPLINLLSMAFGLIIVISLIIGGIQYTASTGDPQKVTEAKKRIVNTIIALVAYLFLFAFLQFLIPGGIFND